MCFLFVCKSRWGSSIKIFLHNQRNKEKESDRSPESLTRKWRFTKGDLGQKEYWRSCQFQVAIFVMFCAVRRSIAHSSLMISVSFPEPPVCSSTGRGYEGSWVRDCNDLLLDLVPKVFSLLHFTEGRKEGSLNWVRGVTKRLSLPGNKAFCLNTALFLNFC